MSEPTPMPSVTPEPTKVPDATPAPIITPDAPSPMDNVKPVDEKKPEAEVKYEFKAPEGFSTKEIEDFAKAHKLAPDVAQKVLDRELAVSQNFIKQQEAQLKELSEKVWPAEIYKDPELGGANIEKTRLNVMKAWNEVPKKIRDNITAARMHTNPDLVHLLNHFGQMTKEDRLAGPPTNQAPPSKASSGLVGLFQNMK
jgi:hypothetical protein